MTDTIESDVTEIIITAGEPPPRRWIWRSEPLAEDVVTFGTLSDPRDARIAELEAALHDLRGDYAARGVALREVRRITEVNDNSTDWDRLQAAGRVAGVALMPREELDA